MSKLFVYGTLRNGEPATHYLENYVMFLIQGKNFQFPMIQAIDGGQDVHDQPWLRVSGNLREVSSKKEWAKLDQYENVRSGLYVREQVEVVNISTGRRETAWVYVGGPRLAHPVIASGDWQSR